MDTMGQIRAERKAEHKALQPKCEEMVMSELERMGRCEKCMPSTITFIAELLIGYRFGSAEMLQKKEIVSMVSSALKKMERAGKVQRLQGIGLEGKIAYVWEIKTEGERHNA